MKTTCHITTPVGWLAISADETAVTAIRFCSEPTAATAPATPLLAQAAHELAAYFAGTCRDFTLPLAPAGTPFQQQVWEALRTIPYGQTRTYGQIATQIGSPRASRAVGMANNRNPIAIVIPCHRVVGADGSLTGYAGGLDVKQQLLQTEKP